VKCAKIPAPHKDLNDWTRAGATADDLFAAMMSAETIREANEPEPDPKEDLQEFRVECLPPLLERQVRAISELCGVPFAMSAPMVLAVASASIGKGLLVRSLPGRITPANLFVLVCKTSGSGGSLTFKHASAPLVGMQQTQRREFDEKEKPRIDAEHAAVSSQIEELKRKAKRAEDEERIEIINELAELNEKLASIEKRVGALLYVTDVTPEKLAEMLSEQNETLAHIDSDAADALGIITGTRYGDGKHSQESLWLKSYTGEQAVVFRKNGKPIHLSAPCLSVLFVATPDKVQELFRNPRLTSGGLLPRFLSCDPGARPVPLDVGSIDVRHTLPSDVSQPYEAAIFASVQRYRFSSSEDDSEEIDMTLAARRLFAEDWNRFCQMSDGSEDLPFEARHTENAIRIAVVLHAFRHVEIEQRSEGTFGARMHAHEHALDEKTAHDALLIRDWFTKHQETLRASQRAAVEDTAWSKTEAMLRDRAAHGITARDLYNGRRVCRDAPAAARLLEVWENEGRITSFERRPEGAGRPTKAYG
jgi:Protein of unknown function (DUF3987)